MKILYALVFLCLNTAAIISAQNYKIIESTSTLIKIEFDFSNQYQLKDTVVDGKTFTYILGEEYSLRKPGEPWLPSTYLNIGIPYGSKPNLIILKSEQEKFSNHFIIPLPDSSNQYFGSLRFDENIYNSNNYFPQNSAEINSLFSMRYAQAAGLVVSPFLFNPITRELLFNKKISVQIEYNSSPTIGLALKPIDDPLTDDFIINSVINPKEARQFVTKGENILEDGNTDTIWYNPQKKYYKIYLNKKGVFRITYENLISSGISPFGGIQQGKFEVICNGFQIPIDIIDNNQNGLFDSSDYFQFIGNAPRPSTPYTYYNTFNSQNIFWFSYSADTVYKYEYINGHPNDIIFPINTVLETRHYELDKMYEPLGYAPDDKRDFWFWDKAEARNGNETYIFRYDFDSFAPNINPNYPFGAVRANLHGMTTSGCNPGHSAFLKFNGIKMAGIKWSNQNAVTISKDIVFSFYSYHMDSVRWLQNGNYFEIGCDGDICTTLKDDIIRINWFEFDHWKWNRVSSSYYNFVSPPNNYGENLYYLWQWKSGNMKVYIPERSQVISNPWILNDADQGVYFVDTVASRTEYFCVSEDSFFVPDSIIADVGSDLRNNSNGADYIIITHKNFKEVAQRLSEFRSNNLYGISNPRVKIVEVQDIYDEFSFGLLEPRALKNFVRFAFNNWQAPAPSYIVLLGDMSFDYREIYFTSRPNYIPSINVQTPEYGQTPSDNEIVCVVGDDIVPDLAIGRLSCETVEEGNILVDKIINYPADNNKNWKENVLLISSGLNAQDEAQFGFNDENLFLEDNYIVPNGFTASKVFRYPNKPRHFPFQGEGPKIREEFNKGAVIANYYGHGGGAQWDLVFTVDDIYQLRNANRLPLVLSVTCYTAHFDNQDIFGEIFNKVPGKGSIGFFGSSGLTWWQAGVHINKELFKEILDRRNYVVGRSILNTKRTVPPNGFLGTQISVLTLLGDPALELALPKYPDFEVKSSDIFINPVNPLKEDTVSVFVKYRNLGVIFPNDSITVQLFENRVSQETIIGQIKRSSFGQDDSLEFKWVPKNAGLYSIFVRVNETDTIWEVDHSDNMASTDIAVFSFGTPNVIRPVDGHFQVADKIDFIFSDIGKLFGRNFNYRIEIDTSQTLTSVTRIISPTLHEIDGIVLWTSPQLVPGQYFWKATIYDDTDTNFSSVNSFSVTNLNGPGYLAEKKQLKNFSVKNMFYSDSQNSLVLNTDTLPPYPNNNFFLDSINVSLPADVGGITSLTNDGSYFYFGHLSFYRSGLPSKIYKIGTGLNGTVRGYNYGSIPNVEIKLKNQFFSHSDGNLYFATGDDSTLLKMNPITGDTNRIFLTDRLLVTEDGLLRDSGVYIISDGNLVYNLSAGYGNRREKYTMRVFNPQNGWQKIGEDILFDGSSFRGFCGFIVVDGYLIVYESYLSGYMRRFRLSDGSFEEQWLSSVPFRGYYALSYDWNNNFVYISTFNPGSPTYKPGFHKFVGKFQDAIGNAVSQDIGPSVNWKNSIYNIDATGSTGNYNVLLLGLNNNTSAWDTLSNNLPPNYSLQSIDALTYNFIKYQFNFSDSSYNPSAPLKLKSLLVNYDPNPEIVISENDLKFSSDTLLQGFTNEIELKVRNLGYATSENLNLKFYMNDADSAFISDTIRIPQDSTKIIKRSVSTSNLIFDSKVKVVAASPVPEFYTFNNITENTFFVSRDSINPDLFITFDGREIVNGDIVSAKPKILITLKDNSPLRLDTSLFTIIFDNIPLSFSRPDLRVYETLYPNSEYTIEWNPTLKDGRHTLEVLAKDSSGNFSDTTSRRMVFYVYNQSDMVFVYNYPNPFKNDTYFTFELRGSKIPDEFIIKIYTIAGRLIREISVPPSNMNIGFNRVYWDGRDQDGDSIANGVYFYKIITRLNQETRVITQKLAKVK